ncbi:3-deoxy-manno-octulosonate cytidylyltransferase [Rhodovibrionaceae bacterium A322]
MSASNSSPSPATPKQPVVLIPARMASTRLPNKPLADIAGLPMIVQVWKRAMEADIGPVVVAAGEQEIVEAVLDAGGQAVLTRPDHPSGSDRIYEALQILDPEGRHDAVINIQGDLPTIEPSAVQAVFEPLNKEAVDIATLAAVIKNPAERDDPNIVKAVTAFEKGQTIARALYFSRCPAPWDGRDYGPGASQEGDPSLPLYHHIGLYAFRREALSRFVALPPSPLEQRERLEQLRALEAGMRIDVALVDTVPLGVDNAHELERARQILGG